MIHWPYRLVRYIMTWRAHRNVIKELNMLSNMELKDIGINRCDIDRLVWQKDDIEKRGKKNT